MRKHWLAVGMFVILMVVLEIVLECPAFGATFQRRGNQSIEFEFDNEMADIILSDLETERATLKSFDEDTTLVWYTDSEGKLAAVITLNPEEFKYLKARLEYLLKTIE